MVLSMATLYHIWWDNSKPYGFLSKCVCRIAMSKKYDFLFHVEKSMQVTQTLLCKSSVWVMLYHVMSGLTHKHSNRTRHFYHDIKTNAASVENCYNIFFIHQRKQSMMIVFCFFFSFDCVSLYYLFFFFFEHSIWIFFLSFRCSNTNSESHTHTIDSIWMLTVVHTLEEKERDSNRKKNQLLWNETRHQLFVFVIETENEPRRKNKIGWQLKLDVL